MSEKKWRLSLLGAIVILSISILVSAFSISDAIRESSNDEEDTGLNEYELARFNDNFEELIKAVKEKMK